MSSISLNKYILCDDIRFEQSGKIFIIGMYKDEKIIVNAKFPYVHNSLSFFMAFDNKKSIKASGFSLINPEGITEIHNAEITINNKDVDNIIICLGGFKFKSPGKYIVKITFENGDIIDESFEVIDGLNVKPQS